MLDQSAAVIEQDDDLHDEITTTKTTQLNADKLIEWRDRTHLLHAQLIKYNDQVERNRQAEQKAQADAEKLAQQRRQEREKAEQIKGYNDRINSFNDRVDTVITEINFKDINAFDDLINAAEKLAKIAIALEGYKSIEGLNSMQQDMNDEVIKRSEINAQNATKDLNDQLDKLPNDKQKIEVIEQLSTKFAEVLNHQSKSEIVIDLLPQLEQQQQTAQQSLNRASYSSPRP